MGRTPDEKISYIASYEGVKVLDISDSEKKWHADGGFLVPAVNAGGRYVKISSDFFLFYAL
ncbi:hypothetical protein HCR_02480 [Hydrogenimonas cancrithermarum]|uniref:Uncharacterized protein n=1 Tax=Hydrogenimonas cancrithermarum TaxID=2993563 RepID=A0ABM8FJW5_9BACT|nr:hypothetical protein HCR_02480 [Hydrogenimonas cancrithermarum]